MTIIMERTTAGGNEQIIHRFDNGYGASVIRGAWTYGGADGLWELGVIRFTGETWALDYETEITSDVEGYLTDEDVDELLTRIENLNPTGVA